MQPDFAGAFHRSQEQPLAAEQDVLEPLDRFDRILHPLLESGYVSGIDLELFAGRKIHFHHAAVYFEKYYAVPLQLLQDKALAAKQSCL